MAEANVHMGVWGCLPGVKRAVRTVPNHLDVHIFDGRYASFGDPDDPVLTPGLEEYAKEHEQTIWHEPPRDELPFDIEGVDDYKLRPGVHKKSMWMFEELPDYEWTLKLDDDEILALFATYRLGELDPTKKYAVFANLREDDDLRIMFLTRLWKPAYWTPWIDDLPYPTHDLPEEITLSQMRSMAYDPDWRMRNCEETDIAYIENRGDERTNAHLQARSEQHESFGRIDRADRIADMVSWDSS